MINVKFPIIVNLFGGPGTGKSTGAAYIFSMLKMLGYNVELVTEAAKDLTWEESFKNLNDQIYVFGKQEHRIFRCADKVDIIITDSPLFLSTIYCTDSTIKEYLDKLVIKTVDKYYNYNVLLNRVKPYSAVGRNQTEEESDELTMSIKKSLDSYRMCYVNYDANKEGYDLIVKDIIKMFNIIKEEVGKNGSN